MAAVRRLARVLLLALILPALLAPRGWAWQVCFCGTAIPAAAGSDEGDCCAPAGAASESDATALDERGSCCDVTSDPSEPCGECGDCLRFDAGNRALQPSQGAPELPLSMPIAVGVGPAATVMPPERFPAISARGLAPPGAPPLLLPLRI